jgi:hypothetical protein
MDEGGGARYYGRRMKRNTLLIVLIVIAGAFLVLNPLQFFTRSDAVPRRPDVDAARLSSLRDFASSTWRSPQDYVLASFERHDVVLLGEFFKIRQNVRLVQDLIPRLHAAGIRNLGIEYALSDDQPEIDALLNAPSWDEARARAVTSHWLVTWGYQEYVDLYRAAWQVNKGRQAGTRPFRIVGLNVRQNWEYLKTQNDLGDPAVVAKIFAPGIPDVHMAEVIDREFSRRGEKALVYCGSQHIFTRYRSAGYEKNAARMKLADARRAGNIVYGKIGTRLFAISLHAPWPDASQKTGLAWPVDGAVDALIAALPPEKQSGGWDTAGTPLGAVPLGRSVYAEGARTGTLADLYDGYVVQGPIAGYEMVTPIRDFIRPAEAERAGREFPGVKPASPPTADQLNKAIADDVDSMAKILSQFKERK